MKKLNEFYDVKEYELAPDEFFTYSDGDIYFTTSKFSENRKSEKIKIHKKGFGRLIGKDIDSNSQFPEKTAILIWQNAYLTFNESYDSWELADMYCKRNGICLACRGEGNVDLVECYNCGGTGFASPQEL